MGALLNTYSKILRRATYKRSKTGSFTEFASNECRVDYQVHKLNIPLCVYTEVDTVSPYWPILPNISITTEAVFTTVSSFVDRCIYADYKTDISFAVVQGTLLW